MIKCLRTGRLILFTSISTHCIDSKTRKADESNRKIFLEISGDHITIQLHFDYIKAMIFITAK